MKTGARCIRNYIKRFKAPASFNSALFPAIAAAPCPAVSAFRFASSCSFFSFNFAYHAGVMTQKVILTLPANKIAKSVCFVVVLTVCESMTFFCFRLSFEAILFLPLILFFACNTLKFIQVPSKATKRIFKSDIPQKQTHATLTPTLTFSFWICFEFAASTRSEVSFAWAAASLSTVPTKAASDPQDTCHRIYTDTVTPFGRRRLHYTRLINVYGEYGDCT